MYLSYGNDVQFYLVYIREAHALDSNAPMTFGAVEDPINDKERHDVAETCVTKLDLAMIPSVVDKIDDKVNRAYGGWPDRLYLVGKDGRIAYAGGRGPSGFKPDELERAILAELEKKEKKATPKKRKL
jgi:type I thyroxine 5'-deiodinase